MKELKQKVAKAEGRNVATLDLVWSGRSLPDNQTLNESSLQDGTIVQLVLRVTEEAAATNRGAVTQE